MESLGFVLDLKGRSIDLMDGYGRVLTYQAACSNWQPDFITCTTLVKAWWHYDSFFEAPCAWQLHGVHMHWLFLRRCQTWGRLICPPTISSYRDHSDRNWVEAGFGNPNQHIRKHSWWNIFRPENNLKDNNDNDSSERGISEFRVVNATESHNSNLAQHSNPVQDMMIWFSWVTRLGGLNCWTGCSSNHQRAI